MSVPESFPQVLIFIGMLVPGFTFVAVRTAVVGWRTPDQGAGWRTLEALFVSAAFIVAYALLVALVFGISALWTGAGTVAELRDWVQATWRSAPAALVAGLGFLLLIGIPAASALFLSSGRLALGSTKRGWPKLLWETVNRNRPTPRAWDHSAYGADAPRFVRILTSTGVYVGGEYAGDSYTSTYPYEKDIFIAHQWKMGKNGEFENLIPDSLGVWVPINDACQLEWIAKPQEDDEQIASDA